MLIPLAFVEAEGQRTLTRFENLSGDASVLIRSSLRDKLIGDALAAVVVDALATEEGGRPTDALYLELLGPTGVPRARAIQPYHRGPRRFVVTGPRRGIHLLELSIADVPLEAVDTVRAELIAGARTHPEGPRFYP